ncbi:MAG: ATP synthase F0 subunit B, partial [Planctomycetaceae bacterium]
REQKITDTIAATNAAHEEARRQLASYERRLAEAADEVRGMLEEARRDSESTRQAIIAEARKAADEEQARAKREIGLAKDDALSQIAEKAGALAVEVAAELGRALELGLRHAGRGAVADGHVGVVATVVGLGRARGGRGTAGREQDAGDEQPDAGSAGVGRGHHGTSSAGGWHRSPVTPDGRPAAGRMSCAEAAAPSGRRRSGQTFGPVRLRTHLGVQRNSA